MADSNEGSNLLVRGVMTLGVLVIIGAIVLIIKLIRKR